MKRGEREARDQSRSWNREKKWNKQNEGSLSNLSLYKLVCFCYFILFDLSHLYFSYKILNMNI